MQQLSTEQRMHYIRTDDRRHRGGLSKSIFQLKGKNITSYVQNHLMKLSIGYEHMLNPTLAVQYPVK